jgi:NADP-dependent 3-hydroxy acid dehydrogenase YdfG
VDILFNCAGWSTGNHAECRVEDWDRSFQLNVRSMFVMCKSMIEEMAAAGAA